MFTVELASRSSFKHLCFCLVPVFWLLGIFGGFFYVYVQMYMHMCVHS